MDRQTIIENARQAQNLHDECIACGVTAVSADAIFAALCEASGRQRKAHQVVMAVPPALWFREALASLKGQRLTLGRFIMMGGGGAMSNAERRRVRQWLVDSGRQPKRVGGQSVFTI